VKDLASYTRRGFLKDHPPVSKRVLLGSGAAEVTLLAGTVLGVKRADGKAYAYTAATTTVETVTTPVYDADCILAEDVTVPVSGDAYALAYVHAAVIDSELVWADGVTAEQQKAALKALRLKGIYASEA
jgi:hypothetical protein